MEYHYYMPHILCYLYANIENAVLVLNNFPEQTSEYEGQHFLVLLDAN